MSVSHVSIPDDRQLTRYLLGLLPEEDAERFDEQSIVDDEMASRLQCVENDLVDAYVGGTLQGELLERFESFYLASPRRRAKVKFAGRFLDAVDRAAAAAVVVPRTAPPRSRFVLSLAPAAMVLLACGVLFIQDVRLRRGLTDAQRDVVTRENRAQALAGQLDEQRVANDAMRRELDRVRATPSFAVVLLPQTRGIGPVPVIALPPGAAMVAFDLALEAGDFSRYEVALKDPATNRKVWQSGILTPDLSRRPATVAVAVPAGVLRPQHYSLELSGRSSAGAFDIVGSYAFQIQSR
jgi:hypothetical protein